MTKPQSPVKDQLALLRDALEAETARGADLQRQLAMANAEFENFVCMAAHNLREPLRDVAAFSQLLAETSAGRLDPDGAAYLDRMRQAAASMQSLLAAVVDYWAAVPGNPQPSLTDMEAVLSQALLRADQQLAQRGAIVTHDPLPAVFGDFELLTLVVHHLIANAVAYGAPHAPCVHVSSKPVDLAWEFSVQDNGLGIAPPYQARIFHVFKRLHGREYPGNGLGLAFCKKAIEGQGGRIRVESTVGVGSTFFFTVPAG